MLGSLETKYVTLEQFCASLCEVITHTIFGTVIPVDKVTPVYDSLTTLFSIIMAYL